jgi:hypothetical protein
MDELKQAAALLMDDDAYRDETSQKIKTYVEENTGATDSILKFIAFRQ